MSSSQSKLIRLRDSGFDVTNPAEDIRGRRVFDRDSEEIGKVDDLLIDEKERKVRFLEISSGGFLGIGDRKFLLPVDAITHINEDTVTVNQNRETISKAPEYNPALTDENDLITAYDHYGYSPFWGPGYIYPEYPFYPPPAPRRRKSA